MVSNNRALSVDSILDVDGMAKNISNTYMEWLSLRTTAEARWEELREYLFATDTRNTSVGTLPWKNSTHLPKLCQIRDNLHANYMAALFPNQNYVSWKGDDESSDAKDKRQAIESYMLNKMRTGGFQTEMAKCLLDLIDYGNCFAMSEFVSQQTKDAQTGELISGYVGPKAVRINPLDIVFNPTAVSFDETPKIVRSLKTLGTLKADIDDHPEYNFYSKVFDKVVEGRQRFEGVSTSDVLMQSEYEFAGFSSPVDYYNSDYVELLDFYGNYYDVREKKFYKNALITVVDRAYIIRNIENPSWSGRSPIKHCGWRIRQDNLYAEGPLDNLVGMQYRIDHLENAKADAYDFIVQPVQLVKGLVEDYDYGPGERIYCDNDSNVEFVRPDTTMLTADTQISQYTTLMEEMAGAPKQAMGIRTPGEKTAFEVQTLENGANRVFINKTNYFEENFMEPLLNEMLEQSRRNMGPSDTIRVMDDQFGVDNFMKITKEDLTASGKIYPIGSRRFQEDANTIQNLVQLYNSSLGQDPTVRVHWSGKQLAMLMEQLLGLEKFKLYGDNVRVFEQAETQKLISAAQQQAGEQAQSIASGATTATPAANQSNPAVEGTMTNAQA